MVLLLFCEEASVTYVIDVFLQMELPFALAHTPFNTWHFFHSHLVALQPRNVILKLRACEMKNLGTKIETHGTSRLGTW